MNLKPISYFLVLIPFGVFFLEIIGISLMIIGWLIFEKKPFQFWREISIQVVVNFTAVLMPLVEIQCCRQLKSWNKCCSQAFNPKIIHLLNFGTID